MTFDQTTIFVALSLLLAAFVKGTTGMGFPLIATPMVALLLDIRTAITILIIPNIVMDITQIFRGSFSGDLFRRFAWLLVLTVCLGVMVLVFVFSTLLRFDFQISPHLESRLSPVVGIVGGFLNGMTNAAGPALAIYLYSLKLEKRQFIKSISTIFIITKVSQLIAVSTWNLFNRSTLLLSLEVTLFILVGFYAGLKTQDRVNQQTFNRGLLVLLFVIGVTLVVRALSP